MYDNTSSSAWCGLYDDSYPGQPGKTLDDAWDIIRPSLPDGTTDENCALIILMNVSHYNGTVNYYSQSKRTTGFVCLSPGQQEQCKALKTSSYTKSGAMPSAI